MKPNIIEIIWHDLGQHLSCYGGNSVQSPYLDRFARQGTLLENMYCAAPQCSPSRASIMTGCYPHTNGLMGLSHLGWNYHEGQRTITHILKEYGYKTYLLGMEHEGRRICDEHVSKTLDYDFILPITGRKQSHVITPSICDFIENKLDTSKPFFMSIGFGDVHRPNWGEVTQEEIDHVILPPYIPDNEGTRKDMAQYEKMIKLSDENTGKVLESISKAGLDNNTIVFFITDHGSEFNRAKMTLYDPGLRVACMFKWKGHIKENRRLSGMRSNIDVLPTLLDLADITKPEFIQGESFKWSLMGYEDKSRDYIIAEKTSHVYIDAMRCIRNDRFKYIKNWDPYQPLQVSEGHSIAMGVDLANQLYGKERPEEELYDLLNDPWEFNNLAYKDDYQDLKENLKAKMFAVLKETHDPLMKGPIRENIVMNKPIPNWIRTIVGGSSQFGLELPEVKK